MRYKLSKRKIEPLEEGEEYFTIRYRHFGERFRTDVGAKDSTEARYKFTNVYYSEKSKIEDCKKKIQE